MILPEYGRLRIGPRWDPARRMIGAEDADYLARAIQVMPKPPLELDRQGVRARSWVGTIGFGGRAIEIVPKIDRVDTLEVRANLLWMLSIAGLVDVTRAQIGAMAASGKPLLLAFLALYVEQLAQEYRRGAPRRYQAIEDNRHCLRGKLMLAEHLRANQFQQQRFLTRSDELTADNPLARLLKAALRLCTGQRLDAKLGTDAMVLLGEMDEVGDIDARGLMPGTVQLDRTLERFRPLLHLAEMILGQTSPEHRRSDTPTYRLIFDMNQVFERFVAEALRLALVGTGVSARAQIGGRHLLSQHGHGHFALRPDIGLVRERRIEAIIDTKWKRLRAAQRNLGIAQADMYQAYAYGRAFDVDQTLLLYPRTDDLPAATSDYEHHPDPESDRRRRIGIRTLDLSRPLGEWSVRTRLLADLRELALEAIGIEGRS